MCIGLKGLRDDMGQLLHDSNALTIYFAIYFVFCGDERHLKFIDARPVRIACAIGPLF